MDAGGGIAAGLLQPHHDRIAADEVKQRKTAALIAMPAVKTAAPDRRAARSRRRRDRSTVSSGGSACLSMKQIDDQPVQLFETGRDLPRLLRDDAGGGQPGPVQRALAGERGAVFPARFKAAENGAYGGIVPQLLVVAQILIPEQNAENPLRRQAAAVVNDQLRPPKNHGSTPPGGRTGPCPAP